MPKIIISGCNGHMGRVVASLCQGDPQVEIAAGFDVLGSTYRDFPVFSSPAQFQGEADAVIDFSSPAALDGLLEFSMARKIPLVLATTGYTPEQVAQIGAAALQTPIFRSANMSLGINVLLELVKKAAAVLGDSCDIEIVERDGPDDRRCGGGELRPRDGVRVCTPQRPPPPGEKGDWHLRRPGRDHRG